MPHHPRRTFTNPHKKCVPKRSIFHPIPFPPTLDVGLHLHWLRLRFLLELGPISEVICVGNHSHTVHAKVSNTPKPKLRDPNSPSPHALKSHPRRRRHPSCPPTSDPAGPPRVRSNLVRARGESAK
ncbi:hypothetical protein BC936DRAFT_138518 [Jimgerdemannia flammicorona]|uniref:Uncharacterized protein n=1 Tax=Jimgerdemannia flammicorona TaxID=994334 RepID=A0A433DIA2_9FUNG|nr:hypothetical protein BC936DRAFT_138518 [Jimgerdemannia flammicorona]